MKNSKFDWFGLFLALGEILVAILLLINPGSFTTGIIIAAGAILCFLGIKKLISYFREDPKVAAGTDGFLMGAICLFGGIFCIFAAQWMAATQANMIYGSIVLLAGLWKLQNAVNMLRLKFEKWFITGASAALALLAALLILLNIFDLQGLGIFTAVALMIDAALDLVAAFLGKPLIAEKTEDQPKEAVKVKVKSKKSKNEADVD